jgi:hypothetical protein
MRRPVNVPVVVGGVVVALALAGCGGSSGGGSSARQSSAPSASAPADVWPAPADPLKRATAAGLVAETHESLTFHVHAHLDVFVNGKPVAVPAGIGINISDPGVKAFTDTPDGSTAYGGITGCGQPCISPLHTHDNTGIVHTESATAVPNTLGQFFTEWGVPLTSSCVGTHCSPEAIAFYINGSAYKQDPRDISLVNQEEIAVVIGTPPAHIPDTADFSNA